MIYPTARAVWAAAAGAVPAFLIALALPSLWYLGLLWICVLLAFVAVDATAGRGPASLTARLVTAPQVGIGGQFGVKVVATFAGAAPAPVEARVSHDERVVPLASPQGALSSGGALELKFRALRRGLAGFDRLWLR